MSENCDEKCDMKELKQLLLEFLEDRKEIQKINEKHFKNMMSLYNASKRLYEDTVRIQQEIIEKFGNNQNIQAQSTSHENEIIITGVPNEISDEPGIIAEKIFKSIGVENPKSVIMKTRKVVKKPHTRSHNSSAISPSKSANDDTKSIIVSLKNTKSTNEIIKRKCSRPNLISSLVFPKTKNSTKININHLYSQDFYRLFLDARSFLRSKSMSMPKIHNNNKILVKMDNNHPPIPIQVRADLDNLMLLL